MKWGDMKHKMRVNIVEVEKDDVRRLFAGILS